MFTDDMFVAGDDMEAAGQRTISHSTRYASSWAWDSQERHRQTDEYKTGHKTADHGSRGSSTDQTDAQVSGVIIERFREHAASPTAKASEKAKFVKRHRAPLHCIIRAFGARIWRTYQQRGMGQVGSVR